MRCIVILLFIVPCFAFAQQTVDVTRMDVNPIGSSMFYTVSGTPFSPYKYVKVVSGSPYFNDDWMKGIAILAGNRRAKCDFVKLDLLSGEVLYKDSTGTELIATTPIQQLTLIDSASGKEVVFINSSVVPAAGNKLIDGWYQVLEKGTATLYKKVKKSISEQQLYNSATAEQTIHTESEYFIGVTDELSFVKKPRDISTVLSDKKNQLDEFIAANKLTGKTDAAFTEVVEKYNTLAVGH